MNLTTRSKQLPTHIIQPFNSTSSYRVRNGPPVSTKCNQTRAKPFRVHYIRDIYISYICVVPYLHIIIISGGMLAIHLIRKRLIRPFMLPCGAVGNRRTHKNTHSHSWKIDNIIKRVCVGFSACVQKCPMVTLV